IWYICVLSFNDGGDALKGGIYWWPRAFTTQNFGVVFADSAILRSFLISIMRTVISTIATVLFTAMTAYAWSKPRLIGRKLFLALGLITMFFNGGLIPTFLVISSLGLYNNFLVFIIPTLFNFFNLIIFQAFFRELPDSLEEAAMIDGANELRIFWTIILPLSKPVLATISLFHGVFSWNDFFMGSIYIKDSGLEPIATYLYRVIAGSSGVNAANMASGISIQTGNVTSMSVQLATMVVATVPVVMVYPFLQKYFVKGLLIGGVKG
ncbi:MAG: carbohydrate ABC transporter permease, partial [Spirochaetota bacterium]